MSLYNRLRNLGVSHFRRLSSALYITGDKAQNTFSVLTPVVDFDGRDKDSLIANVKARRLNVDVKAVEEKWEYFKLVDSRRRVLEETRAIIGQSIASLLKNPRENSEEIDKLKVHSKIIKDDLKNVKDFYYGIEEATMLQILDLPNVLHPKTPLENDYVAYEYLKKPREQSDDHFTLANRQDLVKFINPTCCYLKNDAAVFEVALQNYFRSALGDLKYTPFSNAHFVKSVVVEGCGKNPDTVFTVDDSDLKNSVNKLHLTGGSSLHSFMAYFTKHSVPKSYFPLAYFSQGRSYRCAPGEFQGLFDLSQETSTSVFVASLEDVFDATVEQIVSLYKPLDYHFRIVVLAAYKLDKSESLRLSVQMFSNSIQSYVEVGNVSFYEDYLSKRLLFNCNVNKERLYPNVVSGRIVNVQKVLGCALENNSVTDRKLMSELLKNHVCI